MKMGYLSWALVTGLLAAPASAVMLQGAGSLPGATRLAIPAVNYVGFGPVQFGNATWSSNYGDSLFGSTTPFAFGNGTAGSVSEPIFRINQATNATYVTMTVTFDNPVEAVLAKLYWTNRTTRGFSTQFWAHDSNGNILFDQGCVADGVSPNCWWQLNDDGADPNRFGQPFPSGPGYFGYRFAQPVIKSVSFSNGFIGVSDLLIAGGGGTAVPEPAAWALLITGFGLVGTMARRRRVVAA